MKDCPCELYPEEGGYKETITEENRTVWDGANAQFRWHKCPNIKDGYSDFELERYNCDKCGYSYTLYYDEMC